MTVGEFVRRLQSLPRDVTITREGDGGIILEIHRGYRDTEWARLAPPSNDEDTIDEEIARAICRRLGIPPIDVGL